MSSVHPLTDLLWVRYLASWAILVVLPGYLLIGRRLGSIDPLSRFYVSFATGTLAVPIVGLLFGWLRVPLQPATYCTFVLALFLVLRSALPKNHSPILEIPSASGLVERIVVVVAGLFFVGITVWAFRDYVAPPHVHDATNHSFLTLRIVETKSTMLTRIFGEPWGSPTVYYLVGWHASAALIAQLSGLAPYVATWYTPVLALGMLPVACAVYWKWLGVPVWCVTGGVLLLVANRTFPLAALEWGGMGIVMGMALAPFVSLLILRGMARGTPILSALGALGLGAMIHVHMSSAIATLILVAVGLFRPSAERTIRFRWPALLTFFAVLFLVVGYDNIHLLREYQTKRLAPPTRDLLPLGTALGVALEAVGELSWMKGLALLGLATAFTVRRCRGIAIASILLTVLYVAMCSFRDPVSQALSQVFYQQPSRVRALQMFLLPPLLPLPLWYVRQRIGLPILRWVPVVLLATIVVHSSRPAVQVHLRRIQGPGIRGYVPFSSDDYRLARQIHELVDPEDWIANTWDDGSAWALHVSGRRFLIPTGWMMGEREGREYRSVVPLLIEDPWPSEIQALRDRGVRYVYVSDTHLKEEPAAGFRRERFARDARFESVLEGKDSALYWIEWDGNDGAQIVADAVRYGSGWKDPEKWGRWAMERKVELRVEVPDAPAVLRIRCAAFPGQQGVQQCSIRADQQTLGSFEIQGAPWVWRSFRIPIPASLRGSTHTIELEFSGQWPGSANDPRLRVCPVQSVDILQVEQLSEVGRLERQEGR